MVPGIFEIALRLRDWHIFILHLMEIFWKRKRKIVVESTAMENATFSNKTANLRQIERGVKNGPKCSSA